MFVALVSVEKHKHALVSKVALAKTLFVQTVDLRISQNVSHALQIYYHHVALSKLPREVTQTLGNQALVSILSSCISPASIVVVLVVLALDKVLSIVVLEGSGLIQYLVDEGVHELDHVAGVHDTDHLIVEFVHDVLADEHSLYIVLHFLWIISYRINILRNLDDIPLFEVLVHHHESITHGTFSERILRDANERANLTLLEQRLLPVDINTYVFCNEPRVANGVVGLLLRHVKVELLDIQSDDLLLILSNDLLVLIPLLFFLLLNNVKLFFDLFLLNHFFVHFLNDVKLLGCTSLLSSGYYFIT